LTKLVNRYIFHSTPKFVNELPEVIISVFLHLLEQSHWSKD